MVSVRSILESTKFCFIGVSRNGMCYIVISKHGTQGSG